MYLYTGTGVWYSVGVGLQIECVNHFLQVTFFLLLDKKESEKKAVKMGQIDQTTSYVEKCKMGIE